MEETRPGWAGLYSLRRPEVKFSGFGKHDYGRLYKTRIGCVRYNTGNNTTNNDNNKKMTVTNYNHHHLVIINANR